MWYKSVSTNTSYFKCCRVLAILALGTQALALVSHPHGISSAVADDENHWVATWTSMPQEVEQSNLPPSPSGSGNAMFRDATLRQTLHMSVGASRIRVQLSNTFGGSDLSITGASVALPTGSKIGVNGIDTSTLAGLTFKGSSSVTIPRGQVVYSDAIDFLIEPQSMLTVNLYLQGGQSGNKITGHPGSRTTSWMQSGNHLNASSVTGASTKHWYFVSVVEAWVPTNTTALVILGDSITDGRGSDDDKNNRWTDLLLARMQSNGITNVAVNNQAAGGNAVLSGGLGPTLLSRYKRDGLQQQGVKYVMIFEGVNDIGSGGGNVGDQLITAFKKIIADCKAAGLTTIGATITPFGGNSYSSGAREQARQKVNQWIMAAGNFDHAVDFAGFIGQGSNLKSQFDSGDHLHPSVAGYQEIANKFPLDIFK
ncbi:SGNH hydrolase-type esterase domain-containing protein [Coniochaeta sp. 2T2.1]|nr:SGNH hydrolase-type esterase domain-containing protein [Coniochaeta sp. 2T2.1]